MLERRTYRASAAQLNYIAQDNPCVPFSAKEACRSTSCPTVRGFHGIKKSVSVGVKTVRFHCEWQSEVEANRMQLFVDSDWAGCALTRRSTSGGLMKLRTHSLKTWSSTQAVVAMSSAETELYALTEGATRGVGTKTMPSEMGVVLDVVHVCTESSAAKSVLSQRGLRNMRHIEVKELWLQAAVKESKVKLPTIAGASNPADFSSKCTDLAN